MQLLFICTGNTCRSPMAAALARHHVAQAGRPWQVESAGLYAIPGLPMAAYATDALIRRHVVVQNHQSQAVTPKLIESADYIFTMTQSHKSELLQAYKNAAGKTYTLREFVDEDETGDFDIRDPFGGTAEVYEACAADLDALMQRLIAKLQDREDDEPAKLE